MKTKSKIIFLLMMIMGFSSLSKERIEVSIGTGITHPLGFNVFNTKNSSGRSKNIWLGYSLNDEYSFELGYDLLNSDINTTEYDVAYIGYSFRYDSSNYLHPIFKLAPTNSRIKSDDGGVLSTLGFKASAGYEVDLKYFSFGVLLNYYYMNNNIIFDNGNRHAFVPIIFLSMHNPLDLNVDVRKSQTEISKSSVCNSNAGVFDLEIEFDYNSYSIKDDRFNDIQKFVNSIDKDTEVRMYILGHTDSIGSHEFNLDLSTKRAKSLTDVIIALGIEKERIKYMGYSYDLPAFDNNTESGRAKNRRAQIKLTNSRCEDKQEN